MTASVRTVVVLISIAPALACFFGGSDRSGPTANERPSEAVYVEAPPAPQPRFVVGDTSASSACAGLFDDCTRAHCTMINAGDAAGTINAELTVYDARGYSLVRTETLYLEPGERKTFQHDFSGFAATRVECGGVGL